MHTLLNLKPLPDPSEPTTAQIVSNESSSSYPPHVEAADVVGIGIAKGRGADARLLLTTGVLSAIDVSEAVFFPRRAHLRPAARARALAAAP